MTRPRLRPDAYYAAVPDGLYALTNRGTVSFTGGSVAQWLDRLAPHLTGERTVDELAEGLPAEQARMLRRVVDALVRAELVQDVGGNPSWALTEEQRDAFAPQIAFLDYDTGRGAELFAGLRQHRVAVLGQDPVAGIAMAALDTVGFAEPPVLGGEPGATDAVLLLDGTAPEGAGAVTAVCWQADAAWTLPTGSAAETVIAMRSTSLRRAALHDGTGAPLSTVARSVVVHQSVRRMVRHATGTEPDDATDVAIGVTDRPLHTAEHSWLTHPAALPAEPDTSAAAAERTSALRARPELDDEEFSRLAASCVDDWFGPFAHLSERHHAQIPLSVAAIDVADPVGLRAAAGLPAPNTVVGYGLDLPGARQAAALRAFEAYGSVMLDPRRLEPSTRDTPVPSDLEGAVRTLRAGAWDGVLWGGDVVDGTPVRLPVRTVFPLLDGELRPPPGYRSAYGAGRSWAEAVRTALIDGCRDIVATEATASAKPFPRLRPDALADPVTEGHLRLCRAIGLPFEVYDLSGVLGVPALAVHRPTGTGYVCAPTPAAALRTGVEHVLLDYQSGGGLPDTPRMPPLPERARGPLADPPGDGEIPDVTEVAMAMHRRGYTTAAVTLDHDRALNAIMPFTVCVVIGRAAPAAPGEARS